MTHDARTSSNVTNQRYQAYPAKAVDPASLHPQLLLQVSVKPLSHLAKRTNRRNRKTKTTQAKDSVGTCAAPKNFGQQIAPFRNEPGNSRSADRPKTHQKPPLRGQHRASRRPDSLETSSDVEHVLALSCQWAFFAKLFNILTLL